jgi:putative flippase GtrA
MRLVLLHRTRAPKRPATSTAACSRLARRVRAGLTHSANWWQVARFLAVGASGLAINLVVFSLLVHGGGVDYLWAAVASNLIALASNFLWNRRWTFGATCGRAALQANRFALVSVVGFGVNLVVLRFGVEFLELPRLAAEVTASAIAAPVNFLGSRQWAFRAGTRSRTPMATPERSAA